MQTAPSRADCERLDRDDPLAGVRAEFTLPKGLIYLDGNSLGALPRATAAALKQVVEEQWGQELIGSWNSHDWINLPARVGAAIAPLIGARAHEVLACDSTSVNLFKLLAAALKARPQRRTVVSERGNFPTDLYVMQGVCELLGAKLKRCERGELAQAVDADTAVLALTHVDYRSGELHDMATVTDLARERGALMLWDLAHSAGAMPVALNDCGVDLAVGCGYKYLNGGPGAPAFLYVAERLQGELPSLLSGWMGHAAPFEFAPDYRPDPGVKRFACGTPPVLAMSALQAGVALFAERRVEMAAVRDKSVRLGQLFLGLVDAWLADHFAVACPRDAARRGSQVSLSHPQGYAIVQALIDAGVVGDFRAPDVLRFGFTPLYLRYVDVWDAVAALREVMAERRWDQPRFKTRAAVT